MPCLLVKRSWGVVFAISGRAGIKVSRNSESGARFSCTSYHVVRLLDSGCIGGGARVSSSFRVSVTHGDKPLLGVHVEITKPRRESGEDEVVVFSGTTATDGTIKVKLPTGEYRLGVQYLGISVEYECFHIGGSGRSKAEKHLKHTWGELAPAIREMKGRLSNAEPDSHDKTQLSFLHRVNIPVAGAKLQMPGPTNKEPYKAMTNTTGDFSFGPVPDGTYVLHGRGRAKTRISST
jgi:hypothetical protein